MGQVAGTSPLKGLHAWTCYTLKQQNLGRFHWNSGKRRDVKGAVQNSETKFTKLTEKNIEINSTLSIYKINQSFTISKRFFFLFRVRYTTDSEQKNSSYSNKAWNANKTYSQSTSRVTAIFEIWTEFWKLHVSFEHCQRDFRVPVKIPPVYWRYKAMNFSLYYRIKYFKKNSCFPSILNPFFQFTCLFRNDFQRNNIPFTCRSLQRKIRMSISFSEILVMRDVIDCEYRRPSSWNRVLEGLWDLKYWSAIGLFSFGRRDLSHEQFTRRD